MYPVEEVFDQITAMLRESTSLATSRYGSNAMVVSDVIEQKQVEEEQNHEACRLKTAVSKLQSFK